MAATEIYICRAGQPLNEAKVEYSATIDDRDNALSDAERRCRLNPQIARVVYYRVNEAGDFRVFCSYSNPYPPLQVGATAAGKAKKKRPRRNPAPRTPLWQKISKALRR